jgi:hypothetical protein
VAAFVKRPWIYTTTRDTTWLRLGKFAVCCRPTSLAGDGTLTKLGQDPLPICGQKGLPGDSYYTSEPLASRQHFLGIEERYCRTWVLWIGVIGLGLAFETLVALVILVVAAASYSHRSTLNTATGLVDTAVT